MQVDEELQKVLDNLPAEEPRSRLEPFHQFILRWRREGRSYKRIRQILHDQCHLKVAHATLFEFVQRRSRPRKLHSEAEPQPVTVAQAPTNQVVIGKPRLLKLTHRFTVLGQCPRQQQQYRKTTGYGSPGEVPETLAIVDQVGELVVELGVIELVVQPFEILGALLAGSFGEGKGYGRLGRDAERGRG